jgi:hypothetical protein
MALVKYISERANHHDGIYSTGPWLFGEVKNVPDLVASKMLRHVDVYGRATLEEAPNAPEVVIETKTEDKDQVLRDALAKMSKDQIKTFVFTQFNQSVDMRQSEAKLRAQAESLMDRFGVV